MADYQSRFKTMRHIETVRNYLVFCAKQILDRAVQHDQSKLESPEVDAFDKFTPLLRGVTYGSERYREIMNEMRPAVEHHQKHNRHHPEFFEDGIEGMNLLDLLEMICDWQAASLRHDDGDVRKSIEINKERFQYDDQLEQIFLNTIDWLTMGAIPHKAKES